MEILLEREDRATRHVRQVIFIRDGQPHHVPIKAQTTPEQLRAAFDHLGIGNFEEIRLVCEQKEMTSMQQLVQAAWPSTTVAEVGLTAVTYDGAMVDIQVTNRYFRAIAKIGFHYFLTQFPEFRGNEPIFADIRDFILNDAHPVERANTFMGERALPLIGEMLSGSPKGWQGHAVCAELKGDARLAHVQMFLSEDYASRIYTIRLALDSDLHSRGSGHLYVYYQEGLQGGYAGEAYRLGSSATDIPARPLLPLVALE